VASKDVSINIIADIERYQREIGKIPGATDKQAFKAAVSLERRLTKAQAQAAKPPARCLALFRKRKPPDKRQSI
jgi:hypothetical protein